MIKKIIHTADWHLDPIKFHPRFIHFIEVFLNSIKEETKGYKPEEVLVVAVGDLFDNKSKKQSNEAIDVMGTCLKQISDLYQMIVTIGNHDFDVNNKSSMDCITPIANSFKMQGNTNLTYLKRTKHHIHENICFFNYSNFDDNAAPDVKNIKNMYQDKTYVGLFHDIMLGSKNFKNMDITEHHEGATEISLFEGCDFVMMGDIHKHQEIDNKIPTVYSGSPYQLSYGETVNNHGYCIWDVESKSYEFIKLDTKYALYKIEMNSYNDIDENKEKFVNLN